MDSFKKKALIIGICVVLYLIFIVLWTGSNRFVRTYIDDKLQNIEQQYNITIVYENIDIKGTNGVEIKNLAVLPNGSDTLMSAGSVRVNLDFRQLIFFKAEVTGIEVNNLNLDFIKEGNHSNFDFIYSATGVPSPHNTEDNYALRVEEILNVLFRILPEEVSLHNLKISYLNNGKQLLMEINDLIIKDSHFSAEIKSYENGFINEWTCKSSFLEDEQKIDIRIYAKKDNKITLPFIKHRFGSTIQFDTLAFEIQSIKKESGLLTLKGRGGVKGLTVFDERIATDTILLEKGFANFKVDIGKNYVEIDNRSQIYINKLKLNPYLKVQKNKDWHITASLDKENFPATELFESIPKGLFRHVEGLKADGTLTYHFFLNVDMTDVENLKFRSTLDSHNFRIVQYGNTDLRMMNESFSHTIYENEKPVRTFILGREDPDFRPYHSISRYLPYAIMHAEDAGFYGHKGFLQDAFRRSLVQNIQERRFARGGSTLSMQVVKNVFLSRNKTIARKLEEIMIVWLIETNRLTSKQRMFEVYMNIIEWGPDVYGVTEAARFYFNKEPAALSLTECIFLGYILPDPKNVRFHFNGLQIRPAFRAFHYDAVKRIYQRHWITEKERETSSPSLWINGPAAEYLITE